MSLVFQVETLEEVRDEVMPLIYAHCEEVESIALDPDWDTYDTMEKSGMYLAITARDRGALVGYSSYFIMPKMLHHASRSGAQSDVFYLAPEYRKGWNCVRMLRYCHSILLGDLKITDIFTACKTDHDVGSVLTAMGYKAAETTYHYTREK